MQSKGHAVKTYAWPASLTSTNAGVLLTLPDWPDLSVSGARVPEVTLVATDSVSDWVSRRIDEKAKIPEPSDIGLGQVLIPINAEAAARLDAYLEERQARMFREANEMQQVYDNRRMAYLTDFRASNEPVARMIEYCNDAATEFAAIGIRFCYILNAGGLIAVPAIMEILAPEKGVGSGVRGSMLLWPQRPLWRAYQQDPEAVRRWKEEEYPRIRRRAKRVGAQIFFGDEAGVRSDFHSGGTWGRRGQTPIVSTTGARFSENIISAISAQGQLRFMMTRGRVTAAVFIEFLKRLLVNAPSPIFLIVDGHPTHKAKAVKRFIEKQDGDLELYYLPPYSPELNPDELVWNDLKNKALGRKVILSKEALRNLPLSHLHRLQRLPRLISSFFLAPTTLYASS